MEEALISTSMLKAAVLSCHHVRCHEGMECKMINGQPKCVPLSESTCWAWGDPHYHTFDGLNFDFQGTCTYTISKTTDNSIGLPSFHIFAKNENRGNKRVSYVGMVTIEVYGFLISMFRSQIGFVRVSDG
ncbi:hypothetical protein JD844_005615 [Phrynosoma platyrhinos]|uniref:VWFD domain-containing protein n=1 Tax=Phrynosoma platyrhinos TaxID=52577 RepID=A0ABQ7TPF0_PHRPL|nr:hypothetical protein JD844_005615 [Phrynosoma platyrhinos]